MTKPITLKLTFEELQQIDKFVELNDETRPLFDKIRNAYPEPNVTFENDGDFFDVVSYHDPKNSNSGDKTYWRVEQPNSFSWWRRYTIPQRLDMVQNTEKEQELEKLYQEQLEREMIKRNLKTSLQELANGDVRPIYDVVRETKNQQESWMNKPVEELVAMLEKDPPDCLKFVMSKTLEQLIERWWCDVFVGPNEKWTMEECIADLCDRIFLWLPKEQSAAGSQSLGVEDLVDGFNNAIKKIKSKIHNKKVTP